MANVDIFNMTDTWNAAGTKFNAIKMDVTDTSSSANSCLIDLLISSNSKWAVRKDGAMIYGGDTVLFREATANLALANSTNPQSFYVYNTRTDSSNYERAIFDWTTNSNILSIGFQAAGTGTARAVRYYGASGNYLVMGAFNWKNVTSGGSEISGWDTSGGNFFTNKDKGLIFYNSADLSGSVDSGVGRAAAGVVEVNSGTQGTLRWLNWAGEAYVTTDASASASTTLTDISGLSVTLQNGRKYSFEAQLPFTCAAAGGIKASIAGTASANNVRFNGYIVDSAANGIKGNTQASALGTTVASATTTGTDGIVQIYGSIEVGSTGAGTLTVQWAQNTSNATNTVIKRGAYFIVNDMP